MADVSAAIVSAAIESPAIVSAAVEARSPKERKPCAVVVRIIPAVVVRVAITVVGGRWRRTAVTRAGGALWWLLGFYGANKEARFVDLQQKRN